MQIDVYYIFADNNSCDYKTRRILAFNKILSLVVTDKKFVAYIEELKDKHDEGRIIYTPTHLMQLLRANMKLRKKKESVLNYLKNRPNWWPCRYSKRNWQHVNQEARVMDHQKGGNNKQDDAWKMVMPKAEEANMKQVNGNKYHWCPYHKEEGIWIIHKPEDYKKKPSLPICPQVNQADTNIKEAE